MNIKYALVAALLAGGLLSAPAMAGVTGTTGGTKSDTTVVNKNYTTERNNVTVNKTGKTTNKTVISGTGTRHEWVGVANSATGWRDTSDSYYKVVNGSPSDPAVQSAIASMKSTIKSDLYAEAGRTGGGCGYSVDTSKSSNTTTSTRTTGYSFTSRTTTLDNVESSRSDSTSGSIMVGDSDGLASAYVASGNVSRTTTIEQDYTHHDTYTRTKYTDKTVTTYYEIDGTRTVSPIVLDLDGDGAIEASAGNYLPHPEGLDTTRLALFDFDGNDFPVMTEWVGQNDGLLCRPNADGTIDGTNLFGTANGFANGYDEMSSLDTNNDGQLSGAELDGLMVWVDKDGNALPNSTELHSLTELGITSLSVRHNDMRGSFVRNGQTFNSYDWWPSIVRCHKVDMAKR